MCKAALIVRARTAASERPSKRELQRKPAPSQRMPHPASTFQITDTWRPGHGVGQRRFPSSGHPVELIVDKWVDTIDDASDTYEQLQRTDAPLA